MAGMGLAGLWSFLGVVVAVAIVLAVSWVDTATDLRNRVRSWPAGWEPS